MINLAVVVTTIQEPTKSMIQWREACDYFNVPLYVVGDQKGPQAYPIADEFLAYKVQHLLTYKIAQAGMPPNTYTRKMLGYLRALEDGAMCIYETDDDNAPMENWKPRFPFGNAMRVRGGDWTNAYALFTNEYIWPRGFPPERLRSSEDMTPRYTGEAGSGYYPVQQGLANGAPDVDALWRLTIGNEPFEFKEKHSYEISPGSFCPFNSQSTWWWPEAFTMMYLPVTVPWRATDIWRSLVAQRILWERNHGIEFHGPEVFQDRNPHNLLKDFAEERMVYLRVAEAAEVLRNTTLTNYVSHRSNMVDCYRALEAARLVDPEELVYLHAWLQDVKKIMDQREEPPHGI